MATIQVDRTTALDDNNVKLKGSHQKSSSFTGLSGVKSAGIMDFVVRPENLQLGGLCMIKLKNANGAVVGEALIEDINQVQMRLKYTAGASNLVTKSDNYIEYEIGTDAFSTGASVEVSFSGNLRGSDGVRLLNEPNGGDSAFYASASERGGRTTVEFPIEAQD